MFTTYRALVFAASESAQLHELERDLKAINLDVQVELELRHVAQAAMGWNRPHVVLLCCTTPTVERAAVDCARGIRRCEERARVSRTPIIAICSTPPLHCQLHVAASGVDAILFWPYSVDSLRSMLQEHLGPGIPTVPDENDDLVVWGRLDS